MTGGFHLKSAGKLSNQWGPPHSRPVNFAERGTCHIFLNGFFIKKNADLL